MNDSPGAKSDKNVGPATKKKFLDAFGETPEESTTRISNLEAEMKTLRAKLKKEEDARRTFQEAVRKKEEELKRQKLEIVEVEKKLADEVKNR